MHVAIQHRNMVMNVGASIAMSGLKSLLHELDSCFIETLIIARTAVCGDVTIRALHIAMVVRLGSKHIYIQRFQLCWPYLINGVYDAKLGSDIKPQEGMSPILYGLR